MTKPLHTITLALAQEATSDPPVATPGPNNSSQSSSRNRGRVDHPIASALDAFLTAVDDFRDALRVAVPAVAKQRASEVEAAIKRLSKHEQTDGDGSSTKIVAISVRAGRDLLEVARDIERLYDSKTIDVISKSLYLGLFSAYDSFMGALLKSIYIRKPVLFKAIKREIALDELLEYEDVAAIKADMLEKEIDSFRRESYVDQFAALETKFGLRTLRAFDEWSVFVELGQRRNVIAHNDGCVSQQYLAICDRERVVFDVRPKLKDSLTLEPKYMFDAALVLSKVGFMLAHTLWRKVLEDEVEIAQKSMNDVIYRALLRKRWRTAATFGQFGLTEPMRRGLSDVLWRIRIVNSAIGLKHAGVPEESMQLLDGHDWSACLREFKLANAVLRGDSQRAVELMLSIGERGELVDEMAYHDWPLFHNFRETTEFQEAYEKIYGTPFLAKATEEAKARAKELQVTASHELAVSEDLGKAVPGLSGGSAIEATKIDGAKDP